MKQILILTAFLCGGLLPVSAFDLTLRQRQAIAGESNGHQMVFRPETWNPKETAVIVCDMWDAHHCLNATERGKELVPRMNAVLQAARDAGAMIIHAPSSCLDFYKEHPARKRALAAAKASNMPQGITDWLYWLDAREESAGYPVDASDGGEDDDLAAHEAWAEELKTMGRNPRSPWIRQAAGLEIDPERDAITDHGEENWNLLEQGGIKNVILVGVHLNMCVLGRPFGLRQMVKNGKNVVLMRDMTDTMYNPKMPPNVSHFHGTDLVVQHVETYICPSITSDQLLGGEPFHFAKDPRQHLVILIAEKEYRTLETLPVFAESTLQKDFRLTVVTADPKTPNHFISGQAIASADVLFVSVRRRALSWQQLGLVQNHVAAGKPIIGIRTASHAFSLRGKPAPAGHAIWEDFDSDVWGGHYTGHHGNKIKSFARIIVASNTHPILRGVDAKEFGTGGSLYQVQPLRKTTDVLVMGRAGSIKPHEPVAWTNHTAAGGRAFYTSLGHMDDFKTPQFTTMLTNAVYWVANKQR